MKRLKGLVDWFNDAKGYGYISSPHAEKLFVHYTAIDGPGFKTLVEGQEVEFSIITGPKGPQACAVTKLDRVNEMNGAPDET